MTSKFIVFEGMDGTGKSTISKRILKWLEENNHKAIYTKEPGGSPIGNKIRDIVLYNTACNDLTDILLFMVQRNEHIYRTIKPNLEKDTIVLCDRYIYSSLVYQGYMNDQFDYVYNLHQQLDLIFEPDLLLLFKADPIKTVNRLSNGDKFEINDSKYFNQVQDHYLNDIPKIVSDKCKVEIIDANFDEDNVFEQVKKKITYILSKDKSEKDN